MKLYFWDWGKHRNKVVRFDYNLRAFGKTKQEADENDVFTNLNSAVAAAKRDMRWRKERFLEKYEQTMDHLDSLSPDTIEDVDSVGSQL